MKRKFAFIWFLATLKLYGQSGCEISNTIQPCCNDVISTDPRTQFVSNIERPSMKNKFDWTKEVLKVWHPNSSYFSSLGTVKDVINPFYSTTKYLDGINYFSVRPTGIRTPDKLDFAFEDGWELLHKNDGFAIDQVTQNTLNERREAPYFVLYNKYRGLLRVISGVIPQLSNYSNTIIDLSRTDKYNNVLIRDGLFNKSKAVIAPLDQDPGIDFISHATPSASGESYITADFNMNYDPCMRSVPNYFLFTFTGITKMSVTLSGRLIGTNVPLDPGGSGNSPLQNDRDFLSSVYNDGFNVNGGALTYKNIDALASKFQVLDSPESSQNPITKMFFESAKNGITGLGKAGDDLTNGFVDGKATLLYNKYLGGKEIVKLKNPGFLQKLLTIPTREKLGISLGLISPAASLLTSVLFPSESKEKEPIPSISFIEAEMALSGTIINKSTINNTNYDIEFAIPGSKYTADPIYTPDRYYPLYNEPLGLFALLETPKGVVEYKKVPLNRELVVGCNTNGCPPLIYSEEKLVFKLDRNSIKYVYNKSAEIDEKNTRIYASFEIKERNNCFLNQSVTAQLQNYGIFPPLSYPDVIKNNIFIIQDKGSFATLNDNCSEMVKHFTSIMPLECLFNTGHVLVGQNPAGYFWDIPSYNQIFSYGSDGVGPQDEYIPVQGGSSTNMFANNKEAYLKLHIEYTFKKNKYGKINKFFEILTYPVSLTDGTINLSNTLISSEYLKEKTLPADGYSQGINNYVWDKYNYDAIMTSTSLTTLNAGTEHELTTGAELSGEFELAISDSYLCGAMINPVLDTDVKSFCANKYFGKQYVNNLRLENMVEEQRSAENRPPSEFSFNLYPNPSIGYTYLSVVSPFDGNGKLLINDLSGKTINKFTSEINFASGINESSLDVSDLQAGVYICQLEVGTKKYTQKLVVVK